MKVSIVDYEVGNIFNVRRAFDYLGIEVNLTRDPQDIRGSDKLILPGVGAFQQGMTRLKKFNLDHEVKAFCKTGRPLLGICLGMQILFNKSYEEGDWEGLGLIPGEVKRFPKSANNEYKIPHMCWNQANFKEIDDSRTVKQVGSEIKKDPFFYFAHSYYVETDPGNILLSCRYADKEFAAGVKYNNLIGFQFHPERSGEAGLRLLKMFIEM